MNNSSFGKKMANLRKIINVKLVVNARDYRNYITKPRFVSQKMFSKKFVTIRKIKPVLTHDKPIYIGFSALDLSKQNFITNTLNVSILSSCCLRSPTF